MGGKKAAKPATQKETELSKQQGRILGQREQLFREQQLPLLLDLIQQTEGGGLSNIFAQQQVQDINQAFDVAGQRFEQDIARRGLRGSGVALPALAQLGAGRASAISQALNQARLQNFQRRLQTASLLGQFTPRPSPSLQSQFITTPGTPARGGPGEAIGTVLGAIGGFKVGGPTGAAAGARAGAQVGSQF